MGWGGRTEGGCSEFGEKGAVSLEKKSEWESAR